MARTNLRRVHQRAIDLDSDTTAKELHRHDDEAFLWIASYEDSLHVGQRPPLDAHPLPFPEKGIGEDGKLRTDELLNRVDLRIRHDFQVVPALPEQAHESAGFADLDVGRFVDGVAQKEIAAEQRNAAAHPGPAASRPRFGGRQENVKPFRDKLIVDELLAIAVGPRDAPGDVRRLYDLWQGSAPF